MSNFSEQELVRREKLKKIIELGINPYPAETFQVSHLAVKIKENFKEGEVVKVAGRIMSRRIQGKASFAEIQDSTGKIQVYFNRDEICNSENKSKYNDANWVGFRLIECLPIQICDKADLIATNEPLDRLEKILHIVKRIYPKELNLLD